MKVEEKSTYRVKSLIILSGGKSLRMGTDKADLFLQGETFLMHQIRKGKRLGMNEIVLSGYRGRQCFSSVRIVEDHLKGRGPLGGLEASLSASQERRCLILPVDAVLVPEAVLMELIRFSEGSEKRVVILEHHGRREPLMGVYDSSLAEEMKQELLTGKGSVFDFLRRIGYDIFHTNAPETCFLNINTPEHFQTVNRIKDIKEILYAENTKF